MKIQTKLAAFFVLSVITIVIFINLLAVRISGFVKEEKLEYEQYIGTKIVLGTDTSVIVDYSRFNETFTLNTGQEISKSFVIKK